MPISGDLAKIDYLPTLGDKSRVRADLLTFRPQPVCSYIVNHGLNPDYVEPVNYNPPESTTSRSSGRQVRSIPDGVLILVAYEREEQTMTKTIHGRIHGRIIELDEDLGVVEGQEVEVEVKMIVPKKRPPGPPPGWRPGGRKPPPA